MVKELQKQRISTNREIKYQHVWVEGKLEERAMAAQVEQVKGSVSELASELAAVKEQQQAKCATGEQIKVLEGRMSELAAEVEKSKNFERKQQRVTGKLLLRSAMLDVADDWNREYIKQVDASDRRVTGRMRRLEDWRVKVERELDAADVAVKHLHAWDDLRQARDDLPW